MVMNVIVKLSIIIISIEYLLKIFKTRLDYKLKFRDIYLRTDKTES